MTHTHQAKSPIGRQILWIISAMALCIVVPLLLNEATGGRVNDRNPWWALAVMVVAGACYAAIIASSRRQLFGMVLWMFTYIFMGMAPYVQYRLDVVPGTTPYVDESLYPAAAGVVLVCSGAAVIGALLAGQRRRGVKVMRASVVSPRRANLLTAVAVLLFIYHVSQIGLGAFFMSRGELGQLRTSVWPDSTQATLVIGSLQMCLLVGFLAQMAVRQQRQASGVRASLLPAVLNGALLLYAVNPISSPRYVFGTVILAVLATLGAYATLNRFRFMAVAAMAGMLLIFPLADLFRRTTEATLTVDGPVTALTSGDFDAFVQLTNSLNYVSTNGVTFGRQFLGVLFLWVPRSVWPDKPTATGALLAEHMGYSFTNLSAPIWAELFINFGWIGAVLGMGLVGYWFRIWDVRTDVYLRTSRMPTIAVSATAFYMVIFLRGSLLAVSSLLLLILLAAWFVKERRSQLRRGGRPRVEHRRKAGQVVLDRQARQVEVVPSRKR